MNVLVSPDATVKKEKGEDHTAPQELRQAQAERACPNISTFPLLAHCPFVREIIIVSVWQGPT